MKVHVQRIFLLALTLAILISYRAALAQEPEQPKSPKTTIYYLKHAQAADVERVILALYADTEVAAKIKVVAAIRTNALLINASDEITKQIDGILKELDAAHAPGPAVQVKPMDEIKVFTLKNASAPQSVNVVHDILGKNVQITADDRTNSLIVTGPKQEVEMVEALLVRLDDARSENSMLLKVYPIQHGSPEKIADYLRELGMNALFSMDAEQRRLLVRGDATAHESVAEVLQTIDVAEVNPKLEPMQLRIVWLVEEKLAGKDAREPAKNLEKVIQVLSDKLGVTNLKTAAQLLVTIDPTSDDPNQNFTAHGTTSLQEGIATNLTAEGRIVGHADGKPTIQVSIQAFHRDADPGRGIGGRSNTSSTEPLTSLTTKVAAPAGHSLVLGMAPIQSANSVFVLQILANEDTPAPSK